MGQRWRRQAEAGTVQCHGTLPRDGTAPRILPRECCMRVGWIVIHAWAPVDSLGCRLFLQPAAPTQQRQTAHNRRSSHLSLIHSLRRRCVGQLLLGTAQRASGREPQVLLPFFFCCPACVVALPACDFGGGAVVLCQTHAPAEWRTWSRQPQSRHADASHFTLACGNCHVSSSNADAEHMQAILHCAMRCPVGRSFKGGNESAVLTASLLSTHRWRKSS